MVELSLSVKKVPGGWTVECRDWVSQVMDRESAMQTAEEMAETMRRVGDNAEVVVHE